MAPFSPVSSSSSAAAAAAAAAAVFSEPLYLSPSAYTSGLNAVLDAVRKGDVSFVDATSGTSIALTLEGSNSLTWTREHHEGTLRAGSFCRRRLSSSVMYSETYAAPILIFAGHELRSLRGNENEDVNAELLEEEEEEDDEGNPCFDLRVEKEEGEVWYFMDWAEVKRVWLTETYRKLADQDEQGLFFICPTLHPLHNTPGYMVHPCQSGNLVGLMQRGAASTMHQSSMDGSCGDEPGYHYLLGWLSVFAPVVGLRLTMKMQKQQ